MRLIDIKHYIGNIFHIKSWSNNYERNISNQALYDAYNYVVTTHLTLYDKLDNYYKERHICIPLKKYDNKLQPTIEITYDKHYSLMTYNIYTNIIRVYYKTLYLNPIMYRSILVHEIIHHIYNNLHLSYAGIKWIFKANAIGEYEQDPEEFIADYWRLFYEGCNEDTIVKYLANWYLKSDDKYIVAKRIITRLQNWGYIPT